MFSNSLYLAALDTWWGDLSSVEQIFWAISIVFSILFLIQFVFSLIGLDFDAEADADIHTDVAGHDYSLDADFTLLSVRSIIAFFTFFGWTGIMALNQGVTVWLAFGFASFAGLLAMGLVAYLIFLFSRLSQEGNIDINKALHEKGEVYLTIPANKNGTGKIHLKIDGAFREMEAVTSGDTLPTGTKIKVTQIINDNLLQVEKAEGMLADF